MPETNLDRNPAPASQRAGVQRRSRLHYLYYLLAAFDLITVTLSLLLINQVAGSFEESVEVNDFWARRINDFAELSRRAAAANAPGNDVFESRDPAAESERFSAALDEFDAQADEVRARILALGEGERALLLPAFEDVMNAMAEMAAESHSIFSAFAEDDLARAGEHMAAMDRAYLGVNLALAELTDRAQDIQEGHLERSAERAAAVRRSEWLIAGLIVIMIAGVTMYGVRLARQARQHTQITEALVIERTRELEESHQRLRTAERLASIGTLAAGLGHDMNNVLFPVSCRLDVLDDAGLPDSARAELRSIRSSLEFLQQLSDGLRLLSADPDRGNESAGHTNLHSWSRQVEPLLRTSLKKDVALRIDITPAVREVAIASHQLTQAVFNLVVNAGEAIAGVGEVRISAERGAATPPTVRISVRDTGCGMTEDVRRQALDPFFTTKKRSLSTGLGLALVHGIARAAGGSVEIESVPGAGTTVSMVLPAVSAPAEQESRPKQRRAIVAMTDERMKSVMAGVLQARGWNVEVAEPGAGPRDDSADAWIITIGAASPQRGESFLAGSPARRVILACDEVPNEWDLPGVIPLRPETGLAGIMAAAHALSAPRQHGALSEDGKR